MEAKTILKLVAGGLLVWWGARWIGRRATNEANNETNNLQDDSTAQAAKFYELFGVIRQGGIAVATPVLLTSTKNKIAYLAKNICDWKKIQSAFTKLCGGNYTILEAAGTALSSTDYNGFLNLIADAQKKKRIYCGSSASYSMRNINSYGGIVFRNFEPGQFVGRLQKESDQYYFYIDSDDGTEAGCDKTKFVLK